MRQKIESEAGQPAVLNRAWSYVNATGIEVLRVARFDLEDGDKQYRPVHPTKAGWKIGDPSGLLPLYRLLEIPKSGRVYICEGEKAADAAWTIGLPATTSAHGSAAAEKTDWRPLAGMEVVILPDADEPGGRYAHDVAVILAKLDPPGRVRTLEGPGLPEGGDVVEYIEAHPDDGVEYIAGCIGTLADARPIMLASDLIGGPVLVNMADVEPCEIQWLWPGKSAVENGIGSFGIAPYMLSTVMVQI